MDLEYTPIFIFLIVAVLIAASMLIASAVLGPRKTTGVKQMPYESGMDPIGDARQRFDVRFYLVAIVFLLFDVELLFLYPWAVAQWSADPKVAASAMAASVGATAATTALGAARYVTAGVPPEFRAWVLGEILLFIGVLAAAFAYAWRKGVFEWR